MQRLLRKIRTCTVCARHLSHGPRPVVRANPTARLLLIGQAPGLRVHESGIPWNDRSGERLRAWTGIDPDVFYDESRVAIVPMGFCFPGTDPKGGDYPPRPECAPLWHEALLSRLGEISLTLLIGGYAQTYHLGARRRKTMTETVAAWTDYLPDIIPLPHPSWRNTAWLKRNPWFEAELVPELRQRVSEVLA
ncbi:MAG: uracil-DNA glycosylase family protein [Rhodospirillales bacterium]|nr:uracil-DNA glycosylase family protein [Rhodospirillales bacterium]